MPLTDNTAEWKAVDQIVTELKSSTSIGSKVYFDTVLPTTIVDGIFVSPPFVTTQDIGETRTALRQNRQQGKTVNVAVVCNATTAKTADMYLCEVLKMLSSYKPDNLITDRLDFSSSSYVAEPHEGGIIHSIRAEFKGYIVVNESAPQTSLPIG